MKNSLEKVKKRLGGDLIFITILMFMFFSLSAHSLYNVISHCIKSEERYEIGLAEHGDEKYYAIFIDDREYDRVDYNDFCNYEEDVLSRFARTRCISDNIQKTVRCIFMGAVVMCIIMIFSQIRHGRTPFQKKSIVCLRVAGILIICEELVAFSAQLITEIVSLPTMYFYSKITPTAIFIIVIGVVMLMISEIFRYGCALQEDSDSIA